MSKKICMLGDFGVGKTSLVRRYVLNEFSSEYQTTLGVNIYKYSDQVPRPGGVSTEVHQLIWDVEGGLQRESLLDSYLQGASGAIVVGDVTSANPLDAMRESAERFRRARPGRPAVFCLNKVDLVAGVPANPGADGLAEEYGGVLRYTSAATGQAVPELFRELAQRMLTIGG